MTRKSAIGCALLLGGVLALGVGERAAAQQSSWPPETLHNLQVLEPDTSVQDIVGIMRSVTGDLGVTCTYCHVGDDPSDLSSIDFVSDDKVEKQKARAMLRMVQAINVDLLVDFPGRSDPPVEVDCATCHHGVLAPVDIRDILVGKIAEEGAEAAAEEYRRLRAQYYGSASYDFRDFMLISVAERVGRENPDAAVFILELNAEFYPRAARTYATLAQIYGSQRDYPAAIEALERALEIEPDNDLYKRFMDVLRGRVG